VLTGAVMVQQAPSLSLDSVVAIAGDDLLLPAINSEQLSVHDLAAAGNREQLSALLDRDATRLELRDSKGMTPLAVAAWNGHLDLIADLLVRGAQPDLKNSNGLTPLFCAVDRGRSELARLLIDNGADVMTRGYDGRGLIHMAARSGDTWVLDRAIALGADVSEPDRHGVKPLDLAVWGDHKQAIRTLNQLNATRSELPNPYVKHKKNLDSKHFRIS